MTTTTIDKLASFPWIVSSGTLRTEDLLVRYWETAAQLGADLSAILPTLERLVGEDSSEADWSDDDATECVLQLGDILQELAPPGFYFGASEGDGACFGFWVTEGWSDALETLGFGDDNPESWASLIARLEDDGIDPDNVDDAYQGRAEGWSEERAGADYAQQLAQDSWLPEGPNGLGWNRWPVSCIDWAAAWRELEIGDGYRLHSIGGGDWLVFRAV